ncbi:MAG: glycosyltransferase family 1 protein [Alphaproteobacteria bacterium]|nr:glycosyltransferase family 1 protein [Alphaproteobacteria bacterium]
MYKFLNTRKNAFVFEISDYRCTLKNNFHNIIPCIVDFYAKDDNILNDIYQQYNRNPIVLISSKEAYEFLKQKECPLNIAHFPLSISDKYKITPETRFDKKYDLVIAGRPNPVLTDFVIRYAKSHQHFRYIYRKMEGGKFYYYTSDNEIIGDINTREQYINLLRASRIGIYATPGIDGGEKRTNGFNQVTPRLFELICAGCHILARYPKNADTDYFQIDSLCPSIENYTQFEQLVDKDRETECDMQVYSNYIEHHYTSKRVSLLCDILKNV